jgi:prepilin-type N-terminal cleavage/methylation domain-containing protein
MNRAQQRGFTLLEVLAALSIFLVGIVGVLSLLTSGTRLHQQSEQLAGAADLVDRLLLQVELEAPTLKNLEDGVEVARQPVPGVQGFYYAYKVAPSAGGPPYFVNLEISWLDGGKTQTHVVQHVLKGERTWTQEVRKLQRRNP